jgi:hypothetical protein
MDSASPPGWTRFGQHVGDTFRQHVQLATSLRNHARFQYIATKRKLHRPVEFANGNALGEQWFDIDISVRERSY